MKRRGIWPRALSVAPFAALASVLLLAGCSSPKPMYGWGDYEKQTYVYLKGTDTAYARQIAGLLYPGDEPLGDVLLPPGYHAHLGLLYHLAGDDEQMMQQYGIEKSLYPESAPFMDYLIHQAEQKQVNGRNSTAFPSDRAGKKMPGQPSEKAMPRQPEDSSTVDIPDENSERTQSIPQGVRNKFGQPVKPVIAPKPDGRQFIMLEVSR